MWILMNSLDFLRQARMHVKMINRIGTTQLKEKVEAQGRDHASTTLP